MSTYEENIADHWLTANFYKENGEIAGSRRLKESDTMQLVYGVSWQSGWKENDPYYLDFIKIYRTSDGGWAVYDYECGGYSSVTYEPVQVVCVMIDDNFEAFWNLVLTDDQRDRLRPMKTQIGKFLYV